MFSFFTSKKDDSTSVPANFNAEPEELPPPPTGPLPSKSGPPSSLNPEVVNSPASSLMMPPPRRYNNSMGSMAPRQGSSMPPQFSGMFVQPLNEAGNTIVSQSTSPGLSTPGSSPSKIVHRSGGKERPSPGGEKNGNGHARGSSNMDVGTKAATVPPGLQKPPLLQIPAVAPGANRESSSSATPVSASSPTGGAQQQLLRPNSFSHGSSRGSGSEATSAAIDAGGPGLSRPHSFNAHHSQPPSMAPPAGKTATDNTHINTSDGDANGNSSPQSTHFLSSPLVATAGSGAANSAACTAAARAPTDTETTATASAMHQEQEQQQHQQQQQLSDPKCGAAPRMQQPPPLMNPAAHKQPYNSFAQSEVAGPASQQQRAETTTASGAGRPDSSSSAAGLAKTQIVRDRAGNNNIATSVATRSADGPRAAAGRADGQTPTRRPTATKKRRCVTSRSWLELLLVALNVLLTGAIYVTVLAILVLVVLLHGHVFFPYLQRTATALATAVAVAAGVAERRDGDLFASISAALAPSAVAGVDMMDL